VLEDQGGDPADDDDPDDQPDEDGDAPHQPGPPTEGDVDDAGEREVEQGAGHEHHHRFDGVGEDPDGHQRGEGAAGDGARPPAAR